MYKKFKEMTNDYSGLLVFFTFLIMMVGVSYRIWKDEAPIEEPFQVLSVKGDGVAQLGGVEDIDFTFIRRQECPAVVQGFWLGENQHILVRLPELPGGVTHKSDKPQNVTREVPVPLLDDADRPIDDDVIVYRSIMTSYCPNRVFPYITPDIRFKVQK